MKSEIEERTINVDYELSRFIYDGIINFDSINSEVESLLLGAEACVTLLTDDKLSDKEFYKLIDKFATIDIEESDFINIINLAKGTKYIGKTTIETTMRIETISSEGHGSNFSWWKEDVGIDYEALYTAEFDPNKEHVYTVEELEELVDENKVLLLEYNHRDIFEEELEYEPEEYQNFDVVYGNNGRNYEFFFERGKFYQYTLKYIRKYYTREKLLELYKEYLKHINKEIYEITKDSTATGEYKKFIEAYAREFKEKGFAKRLRIVNKFGNEK